MATSSQIVDFSKVKDGGNFNKKRIPAGDYAATIIKVEDAEAKDKTFQYLVSIRINKHASSVLPYYCKLQENQLWKLRNLLIAAGITVPKKKVKVDINRIVGKVIGVSVEDAEYEGKDQSEIQAVFPAAELDDSAIHSSNEDDDEGDEDGDEEEEAEEVEEDEEEAEEEEPEPELDRAGLKAAIKEFKPDFVAKKSQTDSELRDILTDLQADNTSSEDDEEEEEEEEAPAPKAKVTRKAPAKRVIKKKSADISDEDLDELDIDDL